MSTEVAELRFGNAWPALKGDENFARFHRPPPEFFHKPLGIALWVQLQLGTRVGNAVSGNCLAYKTVGKKS